MNFRIAITRFPSLGEPARQRILAALSEATGISTDMLASRLDSSPSWLFDVPDRDEAEAWRVLLNRQRDVTVAALPSLGRPVPSHREALPRARVALGGGRTGARAGGGRVAEGGPPSQPNTRVSGGSPRRGITAPVGFDGRPGASSAATSGASDPAEAAQRAPKTGRRGITAPVSFLGDGVQTPDTEPQVQSLSEMLEHEQASSEHPVRLEDGDLQLASTRRARGHAPTVAPAGLRRKGIDVRVSTSERVLGPLVRLLIFAIVLGGGVMLWRYFNRPVVNKPVLATIELLEEGRVPLAPLRYAPVEETETYSVALSIEHRVATRQVEVRPGIDTIGGEGRLERKDQGEDYFDYLPTGRETRRGRVRLEAIRVLDVGHTGELPPPWLPDVSEDDMPAMQAFARLLRPPFVQLPVEPVGVGARWRYRQDVDQSPLAMPIDVEVELLGRDGQRLELGLRFKVPPSRDPGEGASAYQRIGPFFVRYDPPVRVFDFAGVGDGRATINLERMTPVSLNVAVQFGARLEAHTDFGQQLIDYSPVVNLEIGED